MTVVQANMGESRLTRLSVNGGQFGTTINGKK
jgi:hypothetical protein